MLSSLRASVERARLRLGLPHAPIDRLLPGPHAVANDYRFLTAALLRLNGHWPRLRASVIVPVYNRRAILEKTLAALCSQTYPRGLFEVIVADDGSRDRPDELIPLYRDALNVSIVSQPNNGFRVAAARNLAIHAATGDVIVSLDCDMLPARNWLRELLAPFHVYDGSLCVIGYRRNVDTSAVSPTAIRQDVGIVERLPRVPAPGAGRVRWAPALDWRVPMYWRTRMLREHSAPFIVAAGGNLAYRTRDAIVAGLHDESFEHWGGEDDEFAYRLWRRGAYFVPRRKAIAYHQAHDVEVPRELHRQETRRLLGQKVPFYRRFVADGSWDVPKVSVIVRADRVDAVLIRAIDSALAQTVPDLEVCVALGSDADAADPTLAPYVTHLRVRMVPHQPGLSASAAANAALSTCRGDLILLMRASDELLPAAAATLARCLDDDTDLAVAYAGYMTVRGGAAVPEAYSPSEHLQRDIMSGPWLSRARDLARVGGWDEEVDGCEDYDLTLRLCERGHACAVPEALARRDDTGHAPRNARRAQVTVVSRALARRQITASIDAFDEHDPECVRLRFDREALVRTPTQSRVRNFRLTDGV